MEKGSGPFGSSMTLSISYTPTVIQANLGEVVVEPEGHMDGIVQRQCNFLFIQKSHIVHTFYPCSFSLQAASHSEAEGVLVP
jgi:hypothetical protein